MCIVVGKMAFIGEAMADKAYEKILDESRWSEKGKKMRIHDLGMDVAKQLGEGVVLRSGDVVMQACEWLEKELTSTTTTEQPLAKMLLEKIRAQQKYAAWEKISAVELMFDILKDESLTALQPDERRILAKCLNYAIEYSEHYEGLSRDDGTTIARTTLTANFVKRYTVQEIWDTGEYTAWNVVNMVVIPLLNDKGIRMQEASVARLVSQFQLNMEENTTGKNNIEKVKKENIQMLKEFSNTSRALVIIKDKKQLARILDNIHNVLIWGKCVDWSNLMDKTVITAAHKATDTLFEEKNRQNLVAVERLLVKGAIDEAWDAVTARVAETSSGSSSTIQTHTQENKPSLVAVERLLIKGAIDEAWDAVTKRVTAKSIAEISASSASSILIQNALMYALNGYIPEPAKPMLRYIFYSLTPALFATSRQLIHVGEQCFSPNIELVE